MTTVTKFSIALVGIAAAAALVFGVFAMTPGASEKSAGFFAPATALAFIPGYGDGGCCDDPEPEPEPEPPTYQPPQNDPDPEPEPEPKPKPVCTLDASPNSIDKGDSATLTWTTQNASSVSINQSIGSVSKNGSKSVSPTVDTTYTLTATGNGKTVTCKDTITVKKPVEKNPSCDAFSLSPSVRTGAGNVTLSWATTNAESVSINQGIGSVADDGSKVVYVSSSKTFTLTVNGHGKTVDCTAHVEVKKEESKTPSCDAFYANDYSVEEGDAVLLTWRTTNADDVYISGIGDVADDGSKWVYPTSDRTYTLTVSGNGKTDTCTLHINVDEDEEENPDKPVCREFEASETRVDEGERITLSWETRDADEIEIEADGDEIYNTTNSSRVRSGSISVRVEEDTTFRLTVHGERNRTDTCTVRVYVDEDPNVTITTTRDREPLTSITFTQVPYTGFGGGLAALFYALIGIFGLAVAYILAVKRGSIFGLSLATFGIGARREDIRAYAAPVVATDSPVYMPAFATTDETKTEETTTLENRAFGAGVMLSPEALRAVMAAGEDLDGRLAILDAVITRAKETFPREDGWIALDQNKVDTLFR